MKTCVECGAVPITNNIRRLYCSDKCRLLHNCKRDDSGCWIWTGSPKTGSKNGARYGKVTLDRDGKRCVMNSHKFSFETFNGPVPPRQVVRHTCHNQRCVNPEHLVLGTHRDNVRDAMERGTHRRGNSMKGSENPLSKITEQQARDILLDERPVRVISAEYGVASRTIYDIKQRVSWKHI